jgi:hypothetical protein
LQPRACWAFVVSVFVFLFRADRHDILMNLNVNHPYPDPCSNGQFVFLLCFLHIDCRNIQCPAEIKIGFEWQFKNLSTHPVLLNRDGQPALALDNAFVSIFEFA